MTRFMIIALALVFAFNIAAAQTLDVNTNGNNTSTNNGSSLWVQTCSATSCGMSCFNCSNSTWINNTNTSNSVVLCPQNGSFCFVDNYWSNGSWTLQNCSGCANSSNSSCSNCTWVMNSFVQDYCADNGTCWSINYSNNSNNSNVMNNTNNGSTVWIQTCSADVCGSSCLNCSSSTWINNRNVNTSTVICPQNGTFCYIDSYWSNGSWTLQNCSSCANSSNSSCSNCSWVMNSFVQDYCANNGTCWSISYNNSMNSTNNGTQIITVNITQTNGTNGTNSTIITVNSSNCNCASGSMTGTDNNGNVCSCPLSVSNITTYPNGTKTTTITGTGLNASIVVAAAKYLQTCLGIILAIIPGWLLL